MGQFRCKQCHQLQFKHRIRGDKIEIEVKCYACNSFNYFTIWLSSLFKELNKKNENEKDNKQEQ